MSSIRLNYSLKYKLQAILAFNLFIENEYSYFVRVIYWKYVEGLNVQTASTAETEEEINNGEFILLRSMYACELKDDYTKKEFVSEEALSQSLFVSSWVM